MAQQQTPLGRGQAGNNRPKYPITVRRATPQDTDTLCRIEKSCFAGDAFTRRQITYLCTRACGTCLIALCDGVVAGYISLLLREKTCNARIYSVAVDPAYQGRGVAKRLIEESLRFAHEHSRRAVTLEVRCGNTAAIALYEGFGFRRTELLRGYYHGGGDGWRMAKELA